MTHEIQSLTGVVYATIAGKELLADLHLPMTNQPVPAIIFIPDGRSEGDGGEPTPDFRRFFADQGFAMVSIDYRMNGEAPFVAAVEDVRTAIRWLRRSAAGFNIDPERIGLWGVSAGSQVAVLSQTMRRELHAAEGYDDVSDRVQAVVGGYGPTDLIQAVLNRDAAAPKRVDRAGTHLTAQVSPADADYTSRSINVPIERVPERTQRADPIHYICDAALPPILILHGLADATVPAQQSTLLFNILARHRRPGMLMLIEELGHGFLDRSDLDAAGPHVFHIRRTAGCEPTIERRYVFDTVRRFFERCFAAVRFNEAKLSNVKPARAAAASGDTSDV